jgi:hypothetical protein
MSELVCAWCDVNVREVAVAIILVKPRPRLRPPRPARTALKPRQAMPGAPIPLLSNKEKIDDAGNS